MRGRMLEQSIHIHGARTHNLKDVSVVLPREAWTAVCGVSGSGKSSLALDTLGAEARRRFLGALARTAEGLDLVPRPDVDRIDGLLPAVLLGARSRPSAR
jgi:excinuclease ABC subunit A